MNPALGSSEKGVPLGMTAIGIFLLFGTAMAFLAGTTLIWRGTFLDRMWALNPRAYDELAPLGKPAGLLFLSLAVALILASTGWFKRRRWGWRLAVAIIGTEVLGNFVNILSGRAVQGLVGITIAGALLLYITRPYVRAIFVVKPKHIVPLEKP
jgi:ABC-type antimicrobial peptide transport system permease subunit